AVFNGYVLPLSVTSFFQPFFEGGRHRGVPLSGYTVEEPDHRQGGLLRACAEWPCDGCPTEKYELPPPHSITLSARTRNDSAIVSPSALAAFKLITSANLLGCWTGRSEGLTPFKILST